MLQSKEVKEEQRNTKDMNHRKKSKMANINPTTPIIQLSVIALNNHVKGRSGKNNTYLYVI